VSVLRTGAELERAVRSGLEQSEARVREFQALPAGAPVRDPVPDVVLAFDRILLPVRRALGWAQLFGAVHPDEGVRERAEHLEQELSAFATGLSLDRDVYDRLHELAPAGASEGLDPETRRVLEHALRDFRRSGVDRDEKTRARVRELRDALVEIGQRFDRNIVRDVRSIRIAEGRAGLAGLPRDYVDAHPEDAGGAVTVTVDHHDYLPFMTYAERADLRRRLHFERSNRAFPQNVAVLAEMLEKRRELARLLGYPSWAAYVTEDKMARDEETVRGFVERVWNLAQPGVERELEQVRALLRRDEPSDGAVRAHDWAYLLERLKRERIGFDSTSVRPYFPYESVKVGVLALASRLYGFELRREDGAPAWHPSVETYSVLDGGRLVARFWLDMFPREGKFKGGAMFPLDSGIEGEVLPSACLECNFTAPGPGNPGLMLHGEVTTFFHELGHLLHHLFARSRRYSAFAGISTEWDFVEVPSQMFEEWAWEPAVLATFARHHETGEPIPAELVRDMRAAEEYGKATQVANQMLYARLSLDYHALEPEGLDTTAHMIELRRRMSPFAHEEGTHFQASFGHLNGYSALYYTYMWSLVIAKDLFSKFERDPFDAELAARYRREVLEPGGSRDAADLARAFLGRDYGFEAWERWLAG